MAVITWVPFAKFDLACDSTVAIPGPITAPWLVALEDLGEWSHLRIEAEGCWTALTGLPECGPDGLPGSAFPADRLLNSDCAVGALVGRIGGSTSSLKPVDGTNAPKPFAVGCYATIAIPPNETGPLFIAVNILMRPVVIKSLKLKLSGARPTFT